MSTPAWQTLSGLTPDAEPALAPELRDAAMRKLVAEVERLATIEFSRATPAGERTLYWDPLTRICNQLEISRIKLSGYCRELTGMRAHEVTDRIKARASLPADFRAVLIKQFESLKKFVLPTIHIKRLAAREYRSSIERYLRAMMRGQRKGPNAATLAARLGYANPSRLNRACLLAFGENIDAMEHELLTPIVQKFLNELVAQDAGAAPALDYQIPPIQYGPLTEDEQEIQDICDAHECRKQKRKAA
jgi:hypothetical protein